MGFLDSLFKKKTPAEMLDRAEALLADGRAYEALRQVQDVAETGQLGERVVELEARCRAALADKALEEADFVEADGELEDAAEWVRSALVQLERVEGQEGRIRDLRSRLKALRAKVREEERRRLMGGFLGRGEDDDPNEGPDPLSLEAQFGTLVGTLRDDLADRYLHRSLTFQQALVDLNEGRSQAAVAGFDAVLEEEPGDPVVLLERGRARLLAGDPIGAREDFEAAWPELGDEYLDQARSLSVPTLWAEACLEQNDPAAVVDGLAGLSGYADGAVGDDPEVALAFARALLQADRLADARTYLMAAAAQFAGRPEFAHLLAESFERAGEPEQAIAVLEQAIAPACTSGGCGTPSLHPPSGRMLARLYLDRTPEGENPPERVGEILALVTMGQGGSSVDDLRLMARYQRARGLDDDVTDTEDALRRMEEAIRAADGASDPASDGASDDAPEEPSATQPDEPDRERFEDSTVSWSLPTKPAS